MGWREDNADDTEEDPEADRRYQEEIDEQSESDDRERYAAGAYTGDPPEDDK